MSINTRVRLDIDNLVLRLINPSDTESIVRYVNDNRDFLRDWEPQRNEMYYTEIGWHHRISQIQSLQQVGFYFQFLIEEKGDENIKGMISYNNIQGFPAFSGAVGYSLSEDAQGKGVMRRALATTNQWLFNERHLHRISAAFMPRNKKSESVLLSAGFIKEGFVKDYLMINGVWEDHVLVGVVNSNWKDPKNSE